MYANATPRRPINSKSKDKDETPLTSRTAADDKLKLKRTLSNLSTPRRYVQKSSTTDIYGQKKSTNIQGTTAPKKIIGTTKKASDVSPMKGQLKSSSSSTTLLSNTRTSVNTPRNVNKKVDKTFVDAPKVSKTKREMLLTNVTVNSPVARKKIIKNDTDRISEVKKGDENERRRTKTRTLDENEAKLLTPDAVDNNAEMQNLTRKLSAKPKAFFVDLEVPKTQELKEIKRKELKGDLGKVISEDDDVSYEDDFESYESDFESYHSDKSSNVEASDGVTNDQSSSEDDGDKDKVNVICESLKENKDEERMLDSGNFDLRDAQRSAQRTKPMEFITEHSEDHADKKTSLTDEGFQDMSSSSAASSMKTIHVDVLDRPLFIDFSKSKEVKHKKQQAAVIKQRAKDLLSMITLHTMSYSLFELHPIPYDVYMATYGRLNYKQKEVQTYDDAISEEIQTDDIEYDDKWTQHPVEFSDHDICFNNQSNNQKRFGSSEDFLSKFTFLLDDSTKAANGETNEEDGYKNNQLRIYLEQRDGVGSNQIFPYEKYRSKLEEKETNMERLKKFMKKAERSVSNILSNGDSKTNESEQISNFPFSDNYVTLSLRNLKNSHEILKQYKIVDVVFSDSKSNLAMTIHRKTVESKDKGLACLWDVSVKMETPLRMLVTVDDVILAKYSGNTDGVFVAALKDGSLHLWNLAENTTYPQYDDNSAENDLQDVERSEHMSQVERDREWNLKNSQVGCNKNPVSSEPLDACAYTSSAFTITSSDVAGAVTGLEMMDGARVSLGNGRKIIGQICSLLEIGLLTIWSIVLEKRNTQVIGKAYRSRTHLEKNVQINLEDYVDKSIPGEIANKSFNLNAAKRRLGRRKSEKSLLNAYPRPKSAASSSDSFDIDRPTSAASRISRNKSEIADISWESGLDCKDLKILKVNGVDHYLVAKNSGEVLDVTRNMGVIKINRICITTDTTAVTKLEVSPHGLPYFLAATETGSVNLCSMLDSRVLLTLDCRNGPPLLDAASQDAVKYHTDSKGRFLGTVPNKTITTHMTNTFTLEFQALLKSLHWLPTNACCIVTISLDGVVAVWQLERSDISPSFTKQTNAVACAHSQNNLAFVTKDGDVEFHRLSTKQNLTNNLSLFQKYVTLL